tara:strand:- start:10054 stop:10191 length:138 start_codon:yes stop_codon:yes gene_type:complete
MYDYHRLIAAAMVAQQRGKSDWCKKYWGGVVDQLVKNMRKQETVH